MTPSIKSLPFAGAIVLGLAFSASLFGADPPPPDATAETPVELESEPGKLPRTVEEARGRARLLHEVLHGVLQVVHRDFFDPDDRDRIPSGSLEEVFEVVKELRGVELRWLGVNGRTMDADHEARDRFERAAVKALATGKEEFEALEGNRFRFAGSIQLHGTCLKCHVPNRRSLEDRFAGLVISMPVDIQRTAGEEE